MLRSLILTLALAPGLALAQSKAKRLDAYSFVANGGLTTEQRVQGLLAIADQLITPVGFMYAGEVLDEALALDPSNTKAQVLNSLIRPMLKLKGYIKRDEPRRSGISDDAKDEFKKDWSGYRSDSSVYAFYWDNSQPAFQNEADYQKFLMDFDQELVRTRQVLKANRNKSFKMNYAFETEDATKMVRQCTVKKVAKFTYDKSACEFETVRPIEFDRPDIEFTLNMINILDLVAVMADAYTMDGMIQITNLKTFKEVRVTDQTFAEYLRAIPEFGLLKTKNQLKRAVEIGTDVLAALRFLTKVGPELCRFDQDDTSRQKNLIEASAFCMYGEFDTENPNQFTTKKLMSVVGSVISGTPIDQTTYDRENRRKIIYKTQMNYGAPVHKPVNDLKGVLPIKFNVCGSNIGFGDPTLAGIFPRGDANEYHKAIGVFSETCKK